MLVTLGSNKHILIELLKTQIRATSSCQRNARSRGRDISIIFVSWIIWTCRVFFIDSFILLELLFTHRCSCLMKGVQKILQCQKIFHFILSNIVGFYKIPWLDLIQLFLKAPNFFCRVYWNGRVSNN